MFFPITKKLDCDKRLRRQHERVRNVTVCSIQPFSYQLSSPLWLRGRFFLFLKIRVKSEARFCPPTYFFLSSSHPGVCIDRQKQPHVLCPTNALPLFISHPYEFKHIHPPLHLLLYSQPSPPQRRAWLTVQILVFIALATYNILRWVLVFLFTIITLMQWVRRL